MRDDMIRVAHRSGASLRQLAEVSGLDRKTVTAIVAITTTSTLTGPSRGSRATGSAVRHSERGNGGRPGTAPKCPTPTTRKPRLAFPDQSQTAGRWGEIQRTSRRGCPRNG
jgi:hypothetical protein